MSSGDGYELPVLPGRLQRLADELSEEGLPALEGAPDPVVGLVELAYALRPHAHEGRVPSYGVLLAPGPIRALGGTPSALDTSVELIPAHDLDLKFACRFADGVTSFAVRSDGAVDHLACFGRNMAALGATWPTNETSSTPKQQSAVSSSSAIPPGKYAFSALPE